MALSNGGGYLFSRREPELSLRHILLEIRAMSEIAPTVLLPQTLGPITRDRDRRRIANALRGVVHLFVRDRPSAQLAVNQLGVDPDRVSTTPDLIFALNRASARARSHVPDAPPRIAMTALDWRWAGGTKRQFDAYLDAMAATLQALLDRGWSVDLRVQVQMRGRRGHDDSVEAREIRRRVSNPNSVTISSPGKTPAEAMRAYASYDLIVGSRLHSALMGLCAGVPSIAIAYQPKAFWIYEDVGLADWVIDGKHLRAENLIELLDRILLDGEESRARAERAHASARSELALRLATTLEPWIGAPTRPFPGAETPSPAASQE